MPVFDFVAFGKAAARYLILIGVVSFVLGISYQLASLTVSMLSFFDSGVKNLSSLFASTGGGSSVSCFWNLFSVLGYDIALNSTLSTLLGIFSLYSGILVELYIMKFGLFLKGLLLRGVS